MNNKKKIMPILPIIISVVCMVVLVALDQASKFIMVSMFEMGEYIGKVDLKTLESIVDALKPIDVIPGVLRFTFVLNDGAAFGSLDNARWIFMILSTVAIVAILVFMFWKKPQNPLLLVALTLITGGGIGNMIDRVWLGYVVDFIDFCALPKIWMWVFNVADSCVTVGAGLLALWMIMDFIRDVKTKKTVDAVIEGATPDETAGGEENDGSEE